MGYVPSILNLLNYMYSCTKFRIIAVSVPSSTKFSMVWPCTPVPVPTVDTGTYSTSLNFGSGYLPLVLVVQVRVGTAQYQKNTFIAVHDFTTYRYSCTSEYAHKHYSCSNVGLVVEYYPATVETRVRFPDVARV